MSEIFGRIVLGIVQGLFELFCQWTGRSILQFCGVKKPNYVASFFLGLTVWTVLACALADYAARSH